MVGASVDIMKVLIGGLRSLAVLGATGLIFAATACGSPAKPAAPEQSVAASAPSTVDATFGTDPTALTYNKALVPDGAHVQVVEVTESDSTKVTLTVGGLVPNRTYGAHAHAMRCGPTGEAAGPHFQNMADPVKPSVNPQFANSHNEIWLDFTTDAGGNATATSTVPWTFTNPRASSVIIHADRTQTVPGKAGTAGARLACVSVGF